MLISQKKYFPAADFWLFLIFSIILVGSVILLQNYPPITITIIPASALFAWYCIRYPLIIPFLLLALSPLYFDTSEGLTVSDLIYFSVCGIFLLFYFIPWISKLQLSLTTTVDKLCFLIAVLVCYSIFIGFLHGTPLFNIFADAVHFLPFFSYFGFRELLKHERGKKVLLFTFIAIILFVAMRNIIYYREIILDAYMPWQQERARVAVNEVILLAGCIFFFVRVVTIEKLRHIVFNLVLFFVVFGNLIITQSRGYWLAFVAAIIALFFISNRQTKKRFLVIASVGVATVLVLFLTFFYAELKLIIDGLIARFETLGTGELDVSLKERLYESQAVWDRIIKNPIAGYGFGTTYRREMIFLNYVEQRTFIHNGYLLTWFKLGLVGFVTFLVLSGTILVQSFRIYKYHASKNIRLIALTVFSLLIGMLLVNNTSPQFYHFDCLLIISLMAIFVSHYYQPQTGKSKDDEENLSH